jgi:hypothetical protein
MAKSKEFKFVWTPNTTKVSIKDLPTNELNKKPGYIDKKSIEQLVESFKATPNFKQLKALLETEQYQKSRKHKPQRYDQMPMLMRVTIRDLLTALAVQRKIDWEHLFKIIANWDSRRPATINVIKFPKKNIFYITDGQHTVMAIAVRAMLGMFPDVDPSSWLDIEVNCQVVETSDFSFAREHFLGINGGDKLSISPYDIHKIHVFSKRLDSPDHDTQEVYEMAEKRQSALEEYNLIPVHHDSVERFKPGAVVHCNKLPQLSIADINFIGENHYTYWPQEPLDAMEMIPLQNLRKKLEGAGADFNTKDFRHFMRDLNALVKEVAGGWAEFKNLTQQAYPAYYSKAYGDDAPSIPNDASIVLLLQLYLESGGIYEFVPKSLTNKYCENGTNMFKNLPKVKRELFV